MPKNGHFTKLWIFLGQNLICNATSAEKDGIYKIETSTTSTGYTKVYCQMTPLPGCSGSGWTMVMKINGERQTFVYNSYYWTNKQTYQPSGGMTAFDDQETKLATYHSTPFNELCLGMKVGTDLNFASIKYSASSLYSLIADSKTRFTNLGRNKWKSLIPKSSLQHRCNNEGFNIKSENDNSANVRIGILGNEGVDGCRTADSFIGFGGHVISHTFCSLKPPSSAACGNVATCMSDNGDAEIKAMGYILVR